MKIELEFHWDNVESNPGEVYRFPEVPTAYMRQYREPGVYRWAVFSNDGTVEAVYVGEAENLRRRLSNYLSPENRQTASRISAFLRDRQKDGKQIRFQTVLFEKFAVNLCQFDCRKLSDPFARKVIENLAIVEALRSQYKVLNKGIDATDKKIQTVFDAVPEFFSQFTDGQKAELKTRLKQFGTTKGIAKGPVSLEASS